MIRLQLLGSPALDREDGATVRSVLAQPKRFALLAYLAASHPPSDHPRDTLLGLFWPELDAERARKALRQALYGLRRSLGPGVVAGKGDELVGVDPGRLWCDAAAFAGAVEEDRDEEALDLYRGPFLEGFHLSGTPSFERWTERARRRLRLQAVDVAWGVAEAAAAEGNRAGARKRAERALALAPYDEESLRRYLTLMVELGQPAAAVRAYDAYVERLAQDLELEPSAETVAVVERIRNGKAAPVRGGAPPSARARSPTGSFVGDPNPREDDSSVVATGSKETPDGEGRGSSESAPLKSRFTAKALVAFGLVVASGVAGWRLLGAPGGETGPRLDHRSMAVLPFNASGAGTAHWQEGLVTLLSAGLDGAAGLRAIDSRTVLARWDEFVSEGRRPDRGLNLSVAEASGAGYALLGSAVSVGERVRLVGDVVDAATGRKLGQGKVEGPQDSVLSLVDRLAVKVLRVVLEEQTGELPAVDVASITTSSVPALQSFLEGEAAYHGGNFPTAIEAYRAAVERDSTFALAHYRLARAYSWYGIAIANDEAQRRRHREAAERFADRLPAREAALLRAHNALRRNAPDALDSLEAATERYPEDAEGWYLLGEGYKHSSLGSPAEGEEAFGRAVALDPGFAPYRIHHVELAFHHLLDSAEATRRSEAYRRLVGSSDPFYPRAFELGLPLVFGSQEARGAALAKLRAADSATVRIMESQTFQSLLWHPMVQDVREAVNFALLDALEGGDKWQIERMLVRGSLSTGQVRKALQYVDRFEITTGAVPCELAVGVHFGIFDPEPKLIDRISSSLRDADDACAALLGAAIEDAKLFEGWVSKTEALAREARVEGDSAVARQQENLLAAWKGFRLLARGRLAEAQELLAAASARGFVVPPAWLGEVHLRLGEMEQAAEVFGREWGEYGYLPLVRRKRARAYEALGEREKAVADYRYFADVWERYADPELQSMAKEAREAIQRLGADQE